MWLLEPEVRARLEAALNSGAAPTAEQQAEYEARFFEDDDSGSSRGSRILSTAGRSAEIQIAGVMTKKPDFLAMLFGGGNTTYPQIIDAIAQAEANAEVDDITLAIDSPGGAFDGLFDALAAIEAAKKPITAVISGVGASAAYAMASQANEIVATNRASRIGSIGVAAEFRVREDSVTITSTNAPRKRPDVQTDEGKAMVVEELDAMHDLFVDAIAKGRGVTPSEVNASFGQGATYLADKAMKRGMIDRVGAAPALKVVGNADTTTARSGGNQPEAGSMDLNELKAKHPDVYAAAMQEGVSQERDRVVAHLNMGTQAGIMDTAVAAIKDGQGMTMTLQSEYMAAAMNKRDTDKRVADDSETAAADGAAATTTQEDEQTRDAKAEQGIWAFAMDRCGVEMGGASNA